ncbi:GNAT family N-acetyltransferase [Micromonospora sp. NPDC049679]|uniref:GNAT family N-acetyltransferase n=1 Tax=Micromonospora sp. NPDC049679 TaxID=3155920 RepID=UPI0033CECC0F
MVVRSVHDRRELAELLRRDPTLHAYALGDLDDFFWPYTTWFRHGDALALVYHGGGVPTLLALADRDGAEDLADLLDGLLPLLPRRFYAHLSPGMDQVVGRQFRGEPGGPHLKMALTDTARLDRVEPAGELLSPADLAELERLYDVAYPGNWFDRRMLETGQYVGVRRAGQLLAVAGVHVWSPTYRVAALGNVTTRPDARGRGLATGAVAALCRRLRETVDHVTLNVKADNAAALAVYTRLGFTPVAEYVEFTFTAVTDPVDHGRIRGISPRPANRPDDRDPERSMGL